jgi:hypothetical protein
MQFSILPL